jgi:DNA invertase Pin-like site-specific DNA recombinase
MTTAIYKRVSSKQQDTKGQSDELDGYRAQLEAKGESVREYHDKFTGKTLERPGWKRLWADVCAGKVNRIVIWRLDRLGRTVSGLSNLFEELNERGVDLVSIRDCLSLKTAAGRLMAHVLASVACYETEVRSERQRAGISVVRKGLKDGTARYKDGKPRTKYGSGRRPGQAVKVNAEVASTVKELKNLGKPIAEIARVTSLSRPTVYAVLGRPG